MSGVWATFHPAFDPAFWKFKTLLHSTLLLAGTAFDAPPGRFLADWHNSRRPAGRLCGLDASPSAVALLRAQVPAAVLRVQSVVALGVLQVVRWGGSGCVFVVFGLFW